MHALNYASEYHHQPIKIECDPKLKDRLSVISGTF